jgi:hypothetical protein
MGGMAAAAGTTSDAVTMVGETNVGAIRVGVIVDGVTEAGVIAVGASHSGAGADALPRLRKLQGHDELTGAFDDTKALGQIAVRHRDAGTPGPGDTRMSRALGDAPPEPRRTFAFC